MTTEAFIATLKRFVSRRGRPSHIYSDCGSNFLGAAKELEDWVNVLKDNSVFDFLATEGISWHFNPPEAPHMGGLWEAAVKSAKYHLKRTVGGATLTLEEFGTILAMVEAVLNSRPLCAMSPEVDDHEALTPGHFLIGKQLMAVPEPSLLDIRENRLSRWQRVSQILQHFWKRWQAEYLHSLQERAKWRRPEKNIEVGDLVLMKHDQEPPLKWKLGRISSIYPGIDGLVRSAEVKTKTSELDPQKYLIKVKEHFYKRPVTKICPLIPANDVEAK
jgi:hypothetical protein